MNPTDCPYIDCQHQDMNPQNRQCPACKQWLKVCGKCHTHNRSFANHCRFCGEELTGLSTFWPGSRGGAQRIGLNRSIIPAAPPDLELTEIFNLTLPGRCRSLLAEDGFLVAVSDDSTIKVVDLNRLDKPPVTYKAGGTIFSEPAIHCGSLYIGCTKGQKNEKGSIHTYTLGGVSLDPPEIPLRWSMELKGSPAQALLPFDNRLYLNMGFKDGHREIHFIDNIHGTKPADPVCVHNGGRSSTLAADPPTQKVFFLTEHKRQLTVNMFDHSTAKTPGMHSIQIKDAPSGLLDYIPIASLGAKLFAVFGENKDLCRLDTHNKTFDTKITNRVRNFAVAGFNKHIVINSTGVYATYESMQENLIRGENIISGPVVLRDKAVAVGMMDGRLRFYHLNNLAIQNDFRVFNNDEKVQVLATFKNTIAAGSPKGGVKLFELTKKE